MLLRRHIPLRDYLEAFLKWTEDAGVIGAVVLGLIYIVGSLLLFPGSVLTMGAGFLYGLLWGTVTVSLASTATACCAFLIGRTVQGDVPAGVIDRIDLDLVQSERAAAGDHEANEPCGDTLVSQIHHKRFVLLDAVEDAAIVTIHLGELGRLVARGNKHADISCARRRMAVRAVEDHDAVQSKMTPQIDLPPRIGFAAGRVKAATAVLHSVAPAGRVFGCGHRRRRRLLRACDRLVCLCVDRRKPSICVDPVGQHQPPHEWTDVARAVPADRIRRANFTIRSNGFRHDR
jgi:hypothetical protein